MDRVESGHGGRGASAAKWMIVLLLAIIAACLLVETVASRSPAQAQTTSASRSGSGVLAVAGQVSRDAYGIYLVDPENRTICVYQWTPDNRELRLMASRYYGYDLMLDAYNTKPAPDEIKALVEGHKRMSGPTSQPEK